MPPSQPSKDPLWQILLRHFTTITIIAGAFWWLAIPRVQAFINETVNDRISTIERRLDNIENLLVHINEQLDRMEKNQKNG
jgi:hypothetical protein